MDGYNEWMNRALALEAQNDILKKEIEILSKTNFNMVQEFHNTFNKEADPQKPTKPSPELAVLRMKLMCEELKETLHELGYDISIDIRANMVLDTDLAKVAKELSDLLYVVYGTAAALGIDIDEVFAEVHRANMSKLGEDGKPIYREDGKVLKGPNYREPNIRKLIDN